MMRMSRIMRMRRVGWRLIGIERMFRGIREGIPCE
jgi:hypothetical protein